MWNRDEVRGKVDQAKGRAKQDLGDIRNDESLRSEGEFDEAAGKIREGFGRARRKVGGVLKDLGDEIER